MNVVVSKMLPIHPSPGEVARRIVSPGEVARRIVRHGLANVLDWLGDKVGPRPDELTHAIASLDPGNRFDVGILFVSEEYHHQLRRAAGIADLNHPDRAVRKAAERAWLVEHRAHRAAVVAQQEASE